MREKVIIFDGEETHEIGAEYFYQHPIIEELTKTEVNNMYEASAIRLKNISKDQMEGTYRAERGVKILEQMVLDLNTKEEGEYIVGIINLLYL